jgi:hypothetical protein
MVATNLRSVSFDHRQKEDVVANQFSKMLHPHRSRLLLTSVETRVCFEGAGYQFQQWSPNTNLTWRVMSTIQIGHFTPSGFASRCDWVLGSREIHREHVSNDTAWGRLEMLPRTIFVQTDELQRFNDNILPCFPNSHKFVIIIGDHDATTPAQKDLRYSQKLMAKDWQAWIDDDRILHLFVEHLDTASPRNRVTPIPLGLNPMDIVGHPDTVLDRAPRPVPISTRQPRMVFTNRFVWVMPRRYLQNQWNDRTLVQKACEQLPHCDLRTKVKLERYVETIEEYPFLLCVHGGGIDPNPNLFTALLAGLIPIITTPFAGQTMYDGWPVVIVDGVQVSQDSNNVTTSNLSPEFLAQKLKEFAPYFEDETKRATVLKRLTSQYWWDKVEARLAAGYSEATF